MEGATSCRAAGENGPQVGREGQATGQRGRNVAVECGLQEPRGNRFLGGESPVLLKGKSTEDREASFGFMTRRNLEL